MQKLLSVLAAIAFLFSDQVFAKDLEWKKIKEKKGIQVFMKEIENSPVVAFKGEGVIDAPLSKVASILHDVKRAPEWSKSIGESKILRWVDKTTYIEYDYIKTPFVIKDREFVMEVKVRYDKADGKMYFDFKSVDDPKAPKTDYIRGEVIKASYVLTPVEDGKKTHLIGELLGDPKGTVPKWIVNYYQRDWPIETIQNLREQAKKSNIEESEFVRGIMQGTPASTISGALPASHTKN